MAKKSNYNEEMAGAREVREAMKDPTKTKVNVDGYPSYVTVMCETEETATVKDQYGCYRTYYKTEVPNRYVSSR